MCFSDNGLKKPGVIRKFHSYHSVFMIHLILMRIRILDPQIDHEHLLIFKQNKNFKIILPRIFRYFHTKT